MTSITPLPPPKKKEIELKIELRIEICYLENVNNCILSRVEYARLCKSILDNKQKKNSPHSLYTISFNTVITTSQVNCSVRAQKGS